MKIHNLSKLMTMDYRQLKPLQGDLKDLSTENHDKLLRVLNKRGFTTPVFVWQSPDDGNLYLLDGHQRQRVMIKNNLNDEGDYNVPYVLIPGDTVAEAKEQLLEITSQYGRITQEGFDDFTADLDFDTEDLFFDALPDLSMDLVEEEGEVEEDEAPEVDDKNPPVSVQGEVYALGNHRLMCGDSTDVEAIRELLDGRKVAMVFTDPPYNAAFNGRSGNHEVILNDKLPTTEFQTFLASFVNTMYAVAPDGPKYVCTDWKMYPLVYDLMQKPNACIVWVKNMFGMGNTYRHQHEFIVFEGKLEANNQSDVWEIKRDNGAEYTHPTQKPVALPHKAVHNSSKRGDVVLDLFGGSGPTLSACEKLGRDCYMVELDPKYCDVIRKRYHKLVSGAEDGWEVATTALNAEAGSLEVKLKDEQMEARESLSV